MFGRRHTGHSTTSSSELFQRLQILLLDGHPIRGIVIDFISRIRQAYFFYVACTYFLFFLLRPLPSPGRSHRYFYCSGPSSIKQHGSNKIRRLARASSEKLLALASRSRISKEPRRSAPACAPRRRCVRGRDCSPATVDASAMAEAAVLLLIDVMAVAPGSDVLEFGVSITHCRRARSGCCSAVHRTTVKNYKEFSYLSVLSPTVQSVRVPRFI